MRRSLHSAVCVILAAVAIATMHGATGHGPADLEAAPAGRLPVPALLLGSLGTSVNPGTEHPGDDHHHDDGTCPCPHTWGALCALLILVAVVAPRQGGRSSSVPSRHAARPELPTGSPDPPVPRARPLLAM